MSIVADTELEKTATANALDAASEPAQRKQCHREATALTTANSSASYPRPGRNADRWQKEGVISTDDAKMKRAKVAKTRKLFRDLPGDERIASSSVAVEIGRQLMERQLSGAAVVTARGVRLNQVSRRSRYSNNGGRT